MHLLRGSLGSSEVLEFPILIVYLIIILSLTLNYLVLKLVHTHCSSSLECIRSKYKFDVSCPSVPGVADD